MRLTPRDIVGKVYENLETGANFPHFNVHVKHREYSTGKHYEYRFNKAHAGVVGDKGNVQMVVTSKHPTKIASKEWEEIKHSFFYSCFESVKSNIPEPEYYHPDRHGGSLVYSDEKVLTILLRPRIETPIGKDLNISKIRN